MNRFTFTTLPKADLIVDALCEGDPQKKTVAGDPLAPLMGAGNRGGFRFTGSITNPHLVVLYTTLNEPNWPDFLDLENGIFFYFGDNRKPGFDLHDRRAGRGGNLILKRMFELVHTGEKGRMQVAPFFMFSRGSKGRDVVSKAEVKHYEFVQ